MNDPIAISLNFDSLNEAYGFPLNYQDPSFFKVFDRLAELAANYSIPLSIFVIGKDLENNNHAAQVKYWAAQGHEIGNHSWSHHFNLASLSEGMIRNEVFRSHDLISKIIGTEPKGFISPAWSTSNTLLSILIEKKYVYDTSSFPSIFLYPMVFKIAINHLRDYKKGLRILMRKDWIHPLKSYTSPHLLNSKGGHTTSEFDSICVLPLPTLGRMHPCIWHTLGYFFGWTYTKRQIKIMLNNLSGFYYLIHPADFLDKNDLDPRYVHHLARLDQPLESKLALLREAFDILKNSGRPFMTMLELANYHKRILVGKPSIL